MSLLSNVPLTARPTFLRHMRFDMFSGAKAGMVQLLLAIASKSFGASEMQMALVACAGGAGMLVSLLLGSAMRGRRKIPFITVPLTLSSLCMLSVFFIPADRLGLFLIVLALQQFFEPMAIPAWTTVMRNNYPGTHRAWLMSHLRRWALIMAAIVAAMSGTILEEDPFAIEVYRLLVPIGGLFGLLAVAMAGRVRVRREKREQAEGFRPPPGALRRVMNDRRYWMYQANFWFFGFANLMLVPLVPKYLTDRGLPYDDIAYMLATVPSAATVITLPYWGRLLDRWNPISMRALTTTIWSMQPLLLFTGPSIAAATGLPFELTVYVAYGMMGLAQGGSTLIWGLGAMYFADRQDVPVYMGVHTGLTGLRRMLAPLVGAVIVSQYSFKAVFGVAWGLQLLAVAMVFTLARFESHGGRLEPFAEREEREARAETAARKNARKQ